MLNLGYLKYISANKQEEMHQSLLRDIYYFYNGVKPEEVIQRDGEKSNVSRPGRSTKPKQR